MKCPKCQTEINSNAKYCTKCGCNLAAEAAKAARPSAPSPSTSCVKCGAALKPGAKFCIKCGQEVASVSSQNGEERTRFLYGADDNSDSGQTITIDSSNVPQGVTPIQDDIVPPDNGGRKEKQKKPKKQKEPKNADKQQEGEKAGNGLIIAAVILLVLVMASGVACVMVWNGTISLPAFASKDAKDTNEDEEESSTEEESGDESESVVRKVDTTEIFAEADALLAEGKNQIAVDAEIINGMESIRSAMNQIAEKAQEAGDASSAADRISDAYASYVTAVIRHKDMMSGQQLSGGIYSQVMGEMRDAEALAEEMAAKGYSVDTSSLVSAKDAFNTSYTEKVVQEFDDFTNRAAWSRTEAWNLMSGFDSIFDNSDPDNPLKLRYAYALSWWIQKQIETELASGTITAKGAAIKIANLIETMDYNPMMINYYISYMNEAGEDCSQVSGAYDEIVQHIADTQGIRIGEDIALDHFWYFNDFGTYSVDATNGVTPENRQWIRNRMSSVAFIQ